MLDDLNKIMQPKTIKIKNNGCGTAPGNLVVLYKEVSLVKIIWAIFGYLLLNLWAECMYQRANVGVVINGVIFSFSHLPFLSGLFIFNQK